MQRVLAFGLSLFVLGFLNSCATKAGTGAWVGAGTGAAVGAGVGAAVGGGEGALIGGIVGAAAGGLTGAAIGSYMDRQEAELKQRVNSAEIIREGDNLVVKFQSGILFDVDRSDLRTGSQESLVSFSEVLTEYPQTTLLVEGHTDSTGGAAYNKKLSVARSTSVTSFLQGRGVQSARLGSVGYGEERPVANNSTPQGRQQNRRVEVKITPIRAAQ